MSNLTAPWDKELTNEQLSAAVGELLDDSFTQKCSYPKVDRSYADPIYNNQMYCLHSFVPSKGATPDKHGVFGFMKCRGCFQNVQEANSRAEFLIRYVDSYHEIQTGYVGRPFPVCSNTKKFVQETHEVDIKKKAVEVISEDIKEKRLQEKREIEEIKKREEKMLEDSKAAQEDTFVQDPMETYIVHQVKKANLIFTYKETQGKLEQMRQSLRNAYKEIVAMEKEHPEFKDEYYERYMRARKQAGIHESQIDNFMNYMGEDIELDFDYKQDE